MFDIPSDIQAIDPGAPQNVNKIFDQADAKLREAKSKKKAKKKIKEEHFQMLRNGRSQSVPATQQGVNQSQQARDVFQRTQPTLGEARNVLDRNQMLQAVTGQGIFAEQGMIMSGSYRAPSIGAFGSMGAPNYNAINDIGELMTHLGQKRGDQSQIMQAMAVVNQDSAQQMNMNNMFQKRMNYFGQLEQKFGSQEMQYKMKEMMFKGIAKTLQMAGQALDMAGQALNTAAQAIDQVATAVAAIPYVGPALSAMLRAVAQMLRMMAQMLKMIAQQLKQFSQKMQQTAQQMMQQAEKMKAQKLLNQAKKMQESQKLQQGMQRLNQIINERNKLSNYLNNNIAHQNSIIQRLQELGKPMEGINAGSGGRGRGGDPMANLMMMNMLGNTMNNAFALQAMNQMMGMNNQMAPGMANLPGIPAMPQVPVVPPMMPAMGGGIGRGGDMPVMPSMPAMPDVAAMPQIPTMPQIPVLPVMPQLPQIGAIEAGGIPQQANIKPGDPRQQAVNQVINPRMAGQQRDISLGRGGIGGQEGVGATTRGGNRGTSKKEDYERRLSDLAQSVLAHNGNDQNANIKKRQDKRTLSMLWNQVIQEKIHVDKSVEQQVVQALGEAEQIQRSSDKDANTTRGAGRDGLGGRSLGGVQQGLRGQGQFARVNIALQADKGKVADTGAEVPKGAEKAGNQPAINNVAAVQEVQTAQPVAPVQDVAVTQPNVQPAAQPNVSVQMPSVGGFQDQGGGRVFGV